MNVGCSKNENNEIFYNNRLILITDEVVEIEEAKAIDNKYENIEVIILDQNDVDSFEFESDDIKVVENSMLLYDNVKNKVLDIMENDFVYFLGNSDIDTLSGLLGHEVTEYRNIYSSQTCEIVSHELVTLNNDYSILKYTENLDLKDRIELISISADDEFINYIIPCLDILVESQTPISHFSNYDSGYWKCYLADKDTGKTINNYIFTNYTIYQDEEEMDKSRDYYLIFTESYLKENGTNLIIEHKGSLACNPVILGIQPTDHNQTTSYQSSFLSVDISYEGPSINIQLNQPNSYTGRWTFEKNASDQSYLSEDHVLKCVTEYGIDQDQEFKGSLTISGQDSDNQVVDSTTISF